MSKTILIAALSGAAGVVVGLLIARQMARAKVGNAIHSGLDAVGLGGGTIENIAQSIVIPNIG